MPDIQTDVKEEAKTRLVCSSCKKPVQFGSDNDLLSDLLLKGSRCTCIEADLNKAEVSSKPEIPNSSDDSLTAVQEILGARYKVESMLGSGGMGAVYRVFDQDLQKTFAIKVLNQQFTNDQQALRRFKQEANAAQNLTHANLAAVYGHGLGKHDTPFLIMDCLDGKNLAQVLNEEGALEPQRAILLFTQIAEAVHYAHSKGVVHRDIKPENVIVEQHDESEVVKLLDFGIALVTAKDKRPTQNLTQTGEIFGSPLYMSPEQCVGNEQDSRSDIYSLGCVMYEVLTGKAPHVGENPVKTILSHIKDEPVPPSVVNNKVPKSLDSIVLHCLEKQPADRYQTADELLKDLQKVIENKPVNIRRASVRLAERQRRFDFYKKFGIAAAIALVPISLAVIALNTHPAPPAPSAPTQSANEMEMLGYMYENGRGVEQSYTKAKELYEKASQAGDTDGDVSLGLLYEDGHGVPKNLQQAAQYYRQAAEAGNKMGQQNLALLYQDGRGVPQDYKEAYNWYLKAANQGNANSQINIGSLYEAGNGVPRDYKKAYEWTMKGAQQGHPQGEYNIGVHYERGLGVPIDYKEALSWYQLALQHGQTGALTAIGTMYKEGKGVTQDYAQALKFFKRAYEARDANVYDELGQMYENGLGVKQDYQQAAKYYREAADARDVKGKMHLARLLRDGRLGKPDPVLANKIFKSVRDDSEHQANSGNEYFQLIMSELYAKGDGVPKDPKLAAMWLKKADVGRVK